MDTKKEPKVAKSSQNFYCKTCDYSTSKKSNIVKHFKTKKHVQSQMDTQGYPTDTKSSDFFCICGKKYKYKQGLYKHRSTCKFVTSQSQMARNGTKWYINDTKMIHGQNPEFQCECGKIYKYHSGYYRHRNICKSSNVTNTIIENTGSTSLKEMFIDLMKQNMELIDKVTEIAKEPKIINNNTQFNVMNYLNTECKNAMNLSDFIEDFNFSMDDLYYLNQEGYQESMKQTFIKQLQDMDKSLRPIHCSDSKRKSFYVKDNDVWEKDDNNKKIEKCIKKIDMKQLKTFQHWKTKNPNWNYNKDTHQFFNDTQFQLTGNSETNNSKLISQLASLSIK